MSNMGMLARLWMERDGHCAIGCVGCHQPIGQLSIDSTGRAHVVSLYRRHPDIELESARGRERVDLHCPFCRVTRASNTPRALLRTLRAGHFPVAH